MKSPAEFFGDLVPDMAKILNIVRTAQDQFAANSDFLSPDEVHLIFQNVRIYSGMLVTAYPFLPNPFADELGKAVRTLELLSYEVVEPGGLRFRSIPRGRPRPLTTAEVLEQMKNVLLNLIEASGKNAQ